MANSSTIKLLNTIEWAKKLNFGRRSALGNFLEPALTSANTVMQTILGPPFAWRWNRDTVIFDCDTTQTNPQDYVRPSPDFGWIETASAFDISQNPNRWMELSPRISIGIASETGRPRFISAQSDDGQGNLTFRLLPVPDQNYPINITLQRKATVFNSINQTWAPIPDEFSYIYNWGFLAMMWLFADDPRFAMANQKFVAHLLGANQGLTATQINIFLNNWQAVTGTPIENANTLVQGTQARQV